MSCSIKLIAISAVLAVVAWFIAPQVGLDSVSLSLGIIIGGIAALIVSSSKAPSQSQDSTDAPKEYKGTTKTLYVGNLPYRANEGAVRELFSQAGKVVSVRLMRDRNTGKRKGFGFVEMAEKDADKAISALNDSEFQQRTLKVREAKDRPEPADTEQNAD